VKKDKLEWLARHWAAKIGVKVNPISIVPMLGKWASISSRGLKLNIDLLNTPRKLCEFVIVYELVRSIHPHNKLFNAFMLTYMPDWERRRDQLDNIGAQCPDKVEKAEVVNHGMC